MRKKILFILSLVFNLIALAVLVWLYFRQGFRGLMQWVPLYQYIFVFLIVFIAALLGLNLFAYFKSKKTGLVIFLVLSFITALLYSGLFGYLLITSHRFENAVYSYALLMPGKDNRVVQLSINTSQLLAGKEIPGMKNNADNNGKVRANAVFSRSILGKIVNFSNSSVLRFAVTSDPHFGSGNSDAEARESIFQIIGSRAYDSLFVLGDNVEMGMYDDQWKQEVLLFSKYLKKIPVRPLFGNHDALINGQFHYQYYFFPKYNLSETKSPVNYSDPYNYRMDFGKTHIIVLNLLWGDEEISGKVRKWLEQQLKQIDQNDWVIVLSHCFFYSSGYTDPGTGKPWYDNKAVIENIGSLLEKYNVDLVLSGHNHYMELLKHGNTLYSVIGSMGGLLDPVPTYQSPYSIFFTQGVHGFADLQISDSNIRIKFINEKGKELYSYIIEK